jgi:hypothetical protein
MEIVSANTDGGPKKLQAPDGKLLYKPTECVKFDLGDTTYGKFGKLKIRGEVPLIGRYIRPNMENAPQTQAFFEQKLRELNISWKKVATGPAGWIRSAIVACACCVPSLDISTNQIVLLKYFYFKLYYNCA